MNDNLQYIVKTLGCKYPNKTIRVVGHLDRISVKFEDMYERDGTVLRYYFNHDYYVIPDSMHVTSISVRDGYMYKELSLQGVKEALYFDEQPEHEILRLITNKASNNRGSCIFKPFTYLHSVSNSNDLLNYVRKECTPK